MPPRINFMGQRLAELDGMSIEFGIAGPHYSGLAGEELANLLYLGSRDKSKPGAIPARDYMSDTILEIQLAVKRALRLAAQASVRGKDPKAALRKGAEAAQEALIRAIHGYHEIPNAPATIEKKGFDNPLVHKGDLADLAFGGYTVGKGIGKKKR